MQATVTPVTAQTTRSVAHPVPERSSGSPATAPVSLLSRRWTGTLVCVWCGELLADCAFFGLTPRYLRLDPTQMRNFAERGGLARCPRCSGPLMIEDLRPARREAPRRSSRSAAPALEPEVA